MPEPVNITALRRAAPVEDADKFAVSAAVVEWRQRFPEGIGPVGGGITLIQRAVRAVDSARDLETAPSSIDQHEARDDLYQALADVAGGALALMAELSA